MPDTVAERTIADEPFLIPRAVLALLAGLLLAGCQGPASTLDPAGRGADDIALLFRIMAAGAAVVWAIVVAIALYAGLVNPRPHSRRSARWLILGGGVLFPTVTLAERWVTAITQDLTRNDATQGVTFVTRMDYLSPLFNETVYCLGVEKLLDVTVF